MKRIATGDIYDESLFNSFARVGSVTVIFIGCLALAGWILNIDTLKSILPGAVTMKANTAVGFLLAGASLWLALSDQTGWRVHRLGQAFAVGVVLIGLLTLIEYLFGWNPGIDQLLFKESVNAVGTFSPGRMAPNTALNFLLLGLGLLFLDWETRARHRPVQYLIITASIISILGLLGHLYGVKVLYGFLNYTSMAINTAVAFIILCLSMLHARPKAGLMAFITSPDMSAFLTRRLLLVALFVPAALGWIRLLGERAGLYDTAFGISLTVIANMAIFVMMILLTARTLNRAENALQQANTDLEKRVIERTAELLNATEHLQKYIRLYDDAPVGYLTFDETGLILTANLTAANLLGIERDFLIKKPLSEFIFEEELDLFYLHCKKLFETGTPQADDLRMTLKDGELHWMRIETIKARDTDDALVGHMALSDISVRKQAEKDILKTSEQLRLLSTELEIIIDTIPALIFYKDTHNCFIRVNKYICDVYKLSKKQMEGISLFDLHSSEQAQAYYDDDLQVIQSRQPKLNIDEPWRTESGNRWLSTSKIPHLNEAGEVVGVIGISMDITERKQMEQEISESRFFLELILGCSPMPIITHDQQGNITQWNLAAEKLLGWTAQDVVGKPPPMIPIERQEQFREVLSSVFKLNNLILADVPACRKDGSEISCEIFIGLLRGAQAEPKGMVAILNDITARKQAVLKLEEKNQELFRRLQNIQALQRIDQTIAGSLDLKLILRVVLEQTQTELHADAVALLLLNQHSRTLEFAAGIGFRSKAIEGSCLHLGEGHGGRIALERKTMSVTNLPENIDQFVRAALLADEGFVTYFGTPLIAKDQVRGVLEVFHRTPFSPDKEWLGFFEVLAGQAAIAVDNTSLFTDLQRSNTELFNAYDSTIEGWSHALDLRDKETEGHTLRVTEMALKLARAAGINEAELVHVRRGSLLHDIGKMGVPDNILLKPGKLTDEEWVVMRKHPIFAFELLSPITYLHPALDIPYCHHEKWDGSGYPRGLKGEQIPLAARLFAIIDVWDALISDRPYRQGWSKEKVFDHIKSLSGTHFEPKAVELFLNMISEDEKNAG